MKPLTNVDTDAAPSPFLRWAGSKRQHVPLLKTFWNESYVRYVEPFAGSAALFFAIRPARALLADLNGELVQAFKAVAAEPDAVWQALARLRPGRRNYYSVRARCVNSMTRAERAARFIYLNRFCFNGLFRTNRAGGFNVPYGAPKNENIPSLAQLRACGKLLRSASISKADFRATLARVKKGDFVYLDPPYAVSNRRIFIEYGSSVFCGQDLEELAQLLKDIAARGATFVVSYADCAEGREALRGWPQKRIPVRRNVAGFLGARRIQYELYATNCSNDFNEVP